LKREVHKGPFSFSSSFRENVGTVTYSKINVGWAKLGHVEWNLPQDNSLRIPARSHSSYYKSDNNIKSGGRNYVYPIERLLSNMQACRVSKWIQWSSCPFSTDQIH
jgi:hypothetical protein